jgi:hypothetical protein
MPIEGLQLKPSRASMTGAEEPHEAFKEGASKEPLRGLEGSLKAP